MALLMKTFPVFVYLSKSSVSLGCFDFYFCAQEGGEKKVFTKQVFQWDTRWWIVKHRVSCKHRGNQKVWTDS